MRRKCMQTQGLLLRNYKQVDGSETVSTLKAILEADTGIAAAEQLLSLTGKGLADG
jgi:hypothetical protein